MISARPPMISARPPLISADQVSDLSSSLRWSSEQLEAERAAKLIVAAEEAIIDVHASQLRIAPAHLAEEQRCADLVADGAGGSFESYARQLKQMMRRR